MFRWGLALFALFIGLVVYQTVAVRRLRYVVSQDLLAELAKVELLEDAPQVGDWPQWRGPRRDGITSMPDLLREWPEAGPTRKWRKTGGDGYSSFAVVGGYLYTMFTTDEGKEAIVSWDLAKGNERWRHTYDPGAEFQYGGPRATPTIDNGKLYTVSSAGVLFCLDTTSGKPIWERDLRQDVGAVAPRWGFAFSPLIEGDLVYVMPGGSRGRGLAAFHKETGELSWTSQDDPAGYSSPIAATIGGVRQILFFTGRRLLSVTPDEGRLLWEYQWLTSFEVNAATPIVIPAKIESKEIAYIFISSGYGKGSALVRVMARAGGEKFGAQAVYETGELCCHFSTPVRYKDHLYALDERRDLTCLNLRTGAVAWRLGSDEGDVVQGGFKKGSLLRVEDVLVVLGEDGKLALVEATPQAYREIASCRPFRDRCWALPVVAEGMLLARDRRQILGFDVRKK
jgi:outer membrane protein assembly factor BamB